MGIDLRVITPNYYYSILRDGRISVFRRLLWVLFFQSASLAAQNDI